MSEGIFGKNADLAQRLKDRIAFHANEHRHTYEIGKGVMDALVLDLLADFRDAGGVILPVKPNGTVWLIRRRRVVSATVMFVGAGADGLTSFSVLRGRLGTTAWSSEQFTEHDIGKTVFLTKEAAEAALRLQLSEVRQYPVHRRPRARPPGRLLRGVCGSLRPGTAEPDPRRRRPRRPVRLLSADPRT